MSEHEKPAIGFEEAANGAAEITHFPPVNPLAVENTGNRLDALERRLPEATQIVAAMMKTSQEVATLQQQLAYLAQQRNFAEVQMERHTRATALDLAIKALPGSDAATMTQVAEAFVGWLKAAPPPAGDTQH